MKQRAMNRLVKAYKKGTGLRFTADEVQDLVYRDTALIDAVNNWDIEDDESPELITSPKAEIED